jgi:hypothetical protein
MRIVWIAADRKTRKAIIVESHALILPARASGRFVQRIGDLAFASDCFTKIGAWGLRTFYDLHETIKPSKSVDFVRIADLGLLPTSVS